jgi:chemotaxis protein MotB
MSQLKTAEAPPPPPIAPRSRSASPRPHRGGAWKVAYADFVTALMALFIVMWMMSSTAKVKASISGYFRDPRGFTHKLGAGPASAGEGLAMHSQTAADLEKQIELALHRVPEFGKIRGNIQMSVTGEGLRIDMLETEQGMFFISGSASPTEAGVHLLRVLAAELGKMPNAIAIEGHTDARPFRRADPNSGYGNWELAVDRGNAARRLLHSSGVRPGQVVEVRGYADQKLLNPEDPNDPKNRRVSVVVKFQ